MSKRDSILKFILFIGAGLFILGGTILVIRWAKGYRPTKNGVVRGTGLLAANSFPSGAEVYINDKLTTATDDTLNLEPGEYEIRIQKDGSQPWYKKVKIVEELVTQTNATLFPSVPSLNPLTFTGAVNAVPSPDGNKIVFAVASASATAKNGLYIQDLGSNALAINRGPRQIARNTATLDFTRASFTWSPDANQVLVSFINDGYILLDTNKLNDVITLPDVTVRLPLIFKEWEEVLAREQRETLLNLPPFMQEVATSSATNIYFSPDGEKILYEAIKDLTIPTGLIPPLPASNTQPETRDIKSGKYYVYDIKEDKNFLVYEPILSTPSPTPKPTPRPGSEPAPTSFQLEKLLLIDNLASPLPANLGASPSAFRKLSSSLTYPQTMALFNAQYSSMHVTQIQWFPDSHHLVITEPDKISIIEYDSTNKTTIYSGPFENTFVYPWPDGSRIVTLIQFTPGVPPNLYAIKLK